MAVFKSREVVFQEHKFGGDGTAVIEKLMNVAEYHNQVKVFNLVTLKPGCSLGYHEHHGNSETYFILEGEGLYNDNGTEMMVGPGVVTFCPDGEGHGVKNAGLVDFKYIALVVNTPAK